MHRRSSTFGARACRLYGWVGGWHLLPPLPTEAAACLMEAVACFVARFDWARSFLAEPIALVEV